MLTPWPAKSPYASDPDFAGKAPEMLDLLVGSIIPEIEKREGPVLRGRAVAGYSLAGLFSMYAFLNGDIFESVASMLGSFWYQGWTEYLSSLHPDKSRLLRLPVPRRQEALCKRDDAPLRSGEHRAHRRAASLMGYPH